MKFIYHTTFMVKKLFWPVILCGVVLAIALNIAGVISIFKILAAVLQPILIGLFLALILNIPTDLFIRKVIKFKGKAQKLNKPLSILITYILAIGLVALSIYVIIPPFVENAETLAKNAPELGEKANDFIDKAILKIGLNEQVSTNIKDKLSQLPDKIMAVLEERYLDALGAAASIFKLVLNLFFAVMLSIYMLIEKEKLISQLRRFIIAILPNKLSNKLIDIAKIFCKIFSAFYGGQMIEALILGVLIFLGMFALKLPYALIVAVVIAITSLIPLLGSYIGGALGFLVVALVSIKSGLIFLAFLIILQQIENNLIYPKVVGKALELSAFWVLTAVLVGGGIGGFWGVMLGVPMFAVVYKVIGRSVRKNPEPESLMPEVLSADVANDKS